MKLTPGQVTAAKALFTLLGLLGLHLILRDFGYRRILEDITSLGLRFFPIALCFSLLFSLLTAAWWLLIDNPRQRPSYPFLFAVSLVANAWNNIGPVSKSLGEPTRVVLLSGRMPVRNSIRSMMLFNLAQAMGTVLTFGVGASLAPFFFPLSDNAFAVTWLAAGLSALINGLAVVWIFWRPSRRSSPTRGRSLRGLWHWMRWTAHQLRKYTKHHPYRYFGAVGLAAAARMSEGLLFWAIFRALGSPLTLLESIAVDVGRGIADNVFFFVPYQLGTREFSIVFMTESVIGKGQDAAVAASLVFRLGEISWIILGYLLGVWLLKKRARPS